MKIGIIGANGFIGSHLCDALLAENKHHVYALDLHDKHLTKHLAHSRFHFTRLNILSEKEALRDWIASIDLLFPLAAIATPALYVKDPLRVFELDFEANLSIVKCCAELQKQVIFPSTSEVYGMCTDSVFDEETSPLITGPINKERWIYSTSKQLLDRVIYSLGKQRGLQYTLFRPFNWFGARLDDIHDPTAGRSRAFSQFLGHILRGEPISLVDGGEQKRCFTYIHDGIRALCLMIENQNARGHIFNIGNPYENYSVKTLAERMLSIVRNEYPELQKNAEKTKILSVNSKDYFGTGYQDLPFRVPGIKQAETILNWKPLVNLDDGIRASLTQYGFSSSTVAG
jgi:nucleoside-diphosphate-sugar epimerase